MNKIKVVYDSFNPNENGITHIAINVMAKPPYVYCTYHAGKESNLLRLKHGLPIITISAARSLFDFVPNKLEEAVAK